MEKEKKISQLILLGHNNSNYKFDKVIIFKNFKEIELQKKKSLMNIYKNLNNKSNSAIYKMDHIFYSQWHIH